MYRIFVYTYVYVKVREDPLILNCVFVCDHHLGVFLGFVKHLQCTLPNKLKVNLSADLILINTGKKESLYNFSQVCTVLFLITML